MEMKKSLTRRVCISASGALIGQTPKSLRAYSFFADEPGRKLSLRAHFGITPSEDDVEDISVVETEIMCEFMDVEFDRISTDIEIVPAGDALNFLPAGIAFLRDGEPGTLCAGARIDPQPSGQ